MSSILNGIEVEEWFKDFAQKSGILNDAPFRMEDIIRLFDDQLNYRLNRARVFIAKEYVDANEWINRVIEKKPLPFINERVKIEFSKRLADLTIGTDTVLQLKNNQGENVIIAVDVTTNDSEVQDKLSKIRGHSSNHTKNNKNENIPFVRNVLGIDKHIVLLLDRTKNKLPSYEKLLDEIYSFAEVQSKTRLIDLTKLEPKERYNWRVEYEADPERMWKRYTQSFNTKPTAVLGLEVAKHALRENHSPKAVLNMLTQDPQYREYLRRDGGDRTRADIHAQGLLGKAQAELEQVRLNDAGQIAKGIGLVLENYGEAQPDGSVEFAGNTFVISKTQDEIVVREKRNGAEIFHLKEGKLLKYSPNSELKSKVSTLVKTIQEQKLQTQSTVAKQQSAKRSR